MSIQVTRPQCAKTYTFDDTKRGKRLRCNAFAAAVGAGAEPTMRERRQP